MAKSDLDKIAIEERLKNEASQIANEHYTSDEEHDYSKNDSYHIYEYEGDLKGKGSDSGNPTASALNLKDLEKLTHDTATNYSGTVNTTVGGGQYDIHGTQGVDGAYQGDSGRIYFTQTSGLNKYSKGEGNEYGEDSVDITRGGGQYVVE